MAISKERLEELINEGATIWCSYRLNYNVIAVDLTDKKRFVIYTDDMSILDRDTEYTYQLKNLYETQKQAEWHLKYHATRIEELNLPYWTDIVRHKDDDVYKIALFRTKNGNTYNLLFKKGALSLWNVRESRVIWVYLATEENYTKLCDLCVKLFKGEQNVTND